MKILSVVVALTLLFNELTLVQADRLVRLLFDDGKDDPNGGSCDTFDDILIDGIITLSGYNFTYTRNLRSSGFPRDLQYFPPKCRRNCEGFVRGKCKATDCVGYRRALGETNADKRELGSGKSFSCDTQIDYINTELDRLVDNSRVSSSCQTLLSKHRTWECYDDVIFGIVERIALWKLHPVWYNPNPYQSIMDSQYSGENICRKSRVDFEPITNSCVDVLFSTITGPNNFYKNSTRSDFHVSRATKTIFGNDFVNKSGIIFPYLGEYTLTSVPDGFLDKTLTMKFNVVTDPVAAIRLWNATTNTIIDSNFTGGTFCRQNLFRMEVVFGGNCATSMMLKLKSPSSTPTSTTGTTWTTSSAPHAVNFGNFTYWGTHRVTIYPDGIYSSEVKVLYFDTVDCE